MDVWRKVAKDWNNLAAPWYWASQLQNERMHWIWMKREYKIDYGTSRYSYHGERWHHRVSISFCKCPLDICCMLCNFYQLLTFLNLLYKLFLSIKSCVIWKFNVDFLVYQRLNSKNSETRKNILLLWNLRDSSDQRFKTQKIEVSSKYALYISIWRLLTLETNSQFVNHLFIFGCSIFELSQLLAINSLFTFMLNR